MLPKPLNGFFEGYDPNINPSLSNEFATATLRFGHSAANRIFSKYDSFYNYISQIDVNDNIFVTTEAYK